MEMDGKCNIMMFNRDVSEDELLNSWKPAFSGITLETVADYKEVVSERVFLDEELIERLIERFSPQRVNRLFSYLVSDIAANGISVPYSFVTAIDRFDGIELTGNDILLSDYTARRLNATVGDTVTLAFFVSAELKILSIEEHQFIVKDVLPIQKLLADGRLSAEYPGLSNADSCTDWDSDLPFNFERIEQEDEDYWYAYRTTPKALIAYTTGASLWYNSYGVATSVRIASDEDWSLSEILSPADVGITLIAPREIGLAAARGGVDFKTLFLSLAFFVIAAALLLATIPLGGMLHDRRKELQLLHAMGYTQKRIKNIILNEITVLTIAATVAGMFFAVLYNRLTLFALGNIWRGAVHTENFITSIEPLSLIIGLLASLAICLATVLLALRRLLNHQSKIINQKSSIKNDNIDARFNRC
jgi:putative ABC transport system permease protein